MNSLNMVVDVEEDENIVCPSCGVTAINSDGPREQPSCQHIRFIYLEGYGFDYAAAELGGLVERRLAMASTPVMNPSSGIGPVGISGPCGISWLVQ